MYGRAGNVWASGVTRQGEIEIGQKVGHGKGQTVRLNQKDSSGSVKRKQPQRLPRKWQISPTHMSGGGVGTLPPKVTGQVCMPSYLREGPFPPLPGSFFPPHLTANKLDAKAITTTTMFTDKDREQNYYQEVELYMCSNMNVSFSTQPFRICPYYCITLHKIYII